MQLVLLPGRGAVDEIEYLGVGQLFQRIARHGRGGRVGGNDGESFVGDENPGRGVVEDYLRQLFLFRTGDAVGDVGVDGDQPTIGHRAATDIEGLAIGAGAFEMVRCMLLGALEHVVHDGLRIAGAIFATFGIEAIEIAQGRGRAGEEFVWDVEQLTKAGVGNLQAEILVEHRNAAGDRFDHGFQQFVLRLQRRRGGLLFADVGVGGDEARQLSIEDEWLTVHQVRATAGAGAFETVWQELACQRTDFADVVFGVAGAIFAALCRNADQIRKTDALNHDFWWQVEHLDEPAVPDPQAKILVEHADALGHAGDDRLQVSQMQGKRIGAVQR